MRHEGTRAGFESVKHKGREITTRLGVLPAGVPNKRVRARGTISSPMIHDMPAYLSDVRDWAVEYYAGTHEGRALYLPAIGRGMRGQGEPTDKAKRVGWTPGYRLMVRDTDTDTLIELVKPGAAVTDNPPVSKRSKMMAPRVSASVLRAVAKRKVSVAGGGRGKGVGVDLGRLRDGVGVKGWTIRTRF